MNKPLLRTTTIGLFILLVGFALAYQFVKPAPPKTVRMATGGENGGYHAFGLAMREQLGDQGIDLVLVNTEGSVENVALLETNDVDIALMQGGTTVVSEHLRGLASLYFEPLWVFIRTSAEEPVTRLQQLEGRNLSMGAAGSGTQALARELFELNDMSVDAFQQLNTHDASSALIAGELDAAFVVGGAESPDVAALLRADGIELVSLERTAAYHLQHRYLSPLVLPAGAIDLAQNRPPVDRKLIGVTAMLVATDEVHPALVDLLLLSAPEIVGGNGLFQRADEFPTDKYLSLPTDDEAARFHKRGPSFLQRYLPFWAATLVDRLIVMLVPLIALMLPLMRLFPPIYRWRVRSRIYRWYADLRYIEARLDRGESGAPLSAAAQRLEDEVKQVDTPLSYADELYHLRGHIELVQSRIDGSGRQTNAQP